MKLIVKKFEELTVYELYEILSARADIFITEQNIFYNDIDRIDYSSYHFFFMEDNKVVAYLRAFYENDNKERLRIGRVLTRNHGNGLGRKLLDETLKYVKDNNLCHVVCMDAQKHAIGFYEKFGFVVISDEFLEEGVVHVKMELNLNRR
ncbi:MAG TPA: GNAT family N-acetyltransferase [Firmicutes bacterium]|nr:GNAT family N-acetyltransferase [Bacillota bacterium]